MQGTGNQVRNNRSRNPEKDLEFETGTGARIGAEKESEVSAGFQNMTTCRKPELNHRQENLNRIRTMIGKQQRALGGDLAVCGCTSCTFDGLLAWYAKGLGNWVASSSRLCVMAVATLSSVHAMADDTLSRNISTALPSEFSKLRYLQLLNLRLNYLSGTVPSEWATMSLSSLTLMGNRLSGPFPTTLTRMTTLLELDIEGNRFSGPIPEGIANLKILNELVLASNDFTGQLPVALAKLTNLTYL
ncbi:hypothetical protein E3N88_04036 [Mikania micrantha]|uniref:Leucine-rich repeat-containing N-terminal plant-type domain-containing protein n=1 Tax=Mikania micrantha TaxID=192012 RepID=A0A5N6PVG3_9ASTR|nr:hypothetical protein E3N88_04036 [Mikania micrantha]